MGCPFHLESCICHCFCIGLLTVLHVNQVALCLLQRQMIWVLAIESACKQASKHAENEREHKEKVCQVTEQVLISA